MLSWRVKLHETARTNTTYKSCVNSRDTASSLKFSIMRIVVGVIILIQREITKKYDNKNSSRWVAKNRKN